jgi:hypothetical protein
MVEVEVFERRRRGRKTKRCRLLVVGKKRCLGASRCTSFLFFPQRLQRGALRRAIFSNAQASPERDMARGFAAKSEEKEALFFGVIRCSRPLFSRCAFHTLSPRFYLLQNSLAQYMPMSC